MKNLLPIVAICLLLAPDKTFAVQVEAYSTSSKDSSKDVALVESQSSFPFEFDVEGTYVGNGDVQRGEKGNLVIRDFDETQGHVHFVFTPMTKIGILRLGVQTERYSFSFGGNAAIPDNLHSTNLVIGLDTELSDSFLIRIELQPGFYGVDFDDFGRDTFNVPAIIGGTYIYSSSLQFVFGVGVDAFRQYPVLPGGGIRWKFAPQWTLNAVAPTPRLEYEPNSNLLFYGGADLRLTSYRVEKNFGTLRGNTALNHAALSYEEVRVGGGLEWKLSSAVKLSVEGGYIPFRDFDFHRTEFRYHQDGGAPYARIEFHAAF
jgi:opacity protein-like surface antigen